MNQIEAEFVEWYRGWEIWADRYGLAYAGKAEASVEAIHATKVPSGWRPWYGKETRSVVGTSTPMTIWQTGGVGDTKTVIDAVEDQFEEQFRRNLQEALAESS